MQDIERSMEKTQEGYIITVKNLFSKEKVLEQLFTTHYNQTLIDKEINKQNMQIKNAQTQIQFMESQKAEYKTMFDFLKDNCGINENEIHNFISKKIKELESKAQGAIQ